MAFTGTGVFNRLYSWVNDAANNLPINATRMDADSNDIAAGLSNCLTRDGQSTATVVNTPIVNSVGALVLKAGSNPALSFTSGGAATFASSVAGTTATFSSTVSGTQYSSAYNGAPGSASTMAYVASGSFGGGIGLIDGANSINLYSVTGALNIGMGATGSLSSKFSLTPAGNLTIPGQLNAGSLGGGAAGGSGAFGTWNISITGNAATATSVGAITGSSNTGGATTIPMASGAAFQVRVGRVAGAIGNGGTITFSSAFPNICIAVVMQVEYAGVQGYVIEQASAPVTSGVTYNWNSFSTGAGLGNSCVINYIAVGY